MCGLPVRWFWQPQQHQQRRQQEQSSPRWPHLLWTPGTPLSSSSVWHFHTKKAKKGKKGGKNLKRTQRGFDFSSKSIQAQVARIQRWKGEKLELQCSTGVPALGLADRDPLNSAPVERNASTYSGFKTPPVGGTLSRGDQSPPCLRALLSGIDQSLLAS